MHRSGHESYTYMCCVILTARYNKLFSAPYNFTTLALSTREVERLKRADETRRFVKRVQHVPNGTSIGEPE